MMKSLSGSDKNFASSGKSTMTKYPTIESRQVTIPSKMKTTKLDHWIAGCRTPSPATVTTDTVHFTDCAGQKTAKCACEGSRAEKEGKSFLSLRSFVPHRQEIETPLQSKPSKKVTYGKCSSFTKSEEEPCSSKSSKINNHTWKRHHQSKTEHNRRHYPPSAVPPKPSKYAKLTDEIS